jgi:hypothetical protein
VHEWANHQCDQHVSPTVPAEQLQRGRGLHGTDGSWLRRQRLQRGAPVLVRMAEPNLGRVRECDWASASRKGRGSVRNAAGEGQLLLHAGAHRCSATGGWARPVRRSLLYPMEAAHCAQERSRDEAEGHPAPCAAPPHAPEWTLLVAWLLAPRTLLRARTPKKRGVLAHLRLWGSLAGCTVGLYRLL